MFVWKRSTHKLVEDLAKCRKLFREYLTAAIVVLVSFVG